MATRAVSEQLDLSSILDCVRDPAVAIGPDRRILACNSLYRTWFNGGREPLGRRCYEVSHNLASPCHLSGEDCPMERCADQCRPIGVHHVHSTPRGDEHEDVVLYPIRGDDAPAGFVEVIHRSSIASAMPDPRRAVGRSRAFNRVLELVQRVAPTDTTVLLTGESGTGKEVIARAVHDSSRRSEGPFVPVDCSGIAETLFESELFGHDKGAFTGAYSRKGGLVEQADGGTLFLDEVGDIPVTLQVKLLRLIESGCFRRVGNARCIPSNFRLICATNRDLEERISQGLFRQDLYFRISAFPIRLPPLRERPDDLELLVESMQERFGGSGLRVDSGAWRVLRGYDFPGNVRELGNLIERAVLLCDGDKITADHLQPLLTGGVNSDRSSGPPHAEMMTLEEAEARYLRWATTEFSGTNRDLARELGITERTLYRKLRQLRENGSCATFQA
jgi:DNA-binding NtrC family response regulator